MSSFIKPHTESIGGRYGSHKNLAVNLDLCRAIEKDKLKWYPDNDGVPSIKFIGCKAEWIFQSMEERDEAYEKIAENTYKAGTEVDDD